MINNDDSMDSPAQRVAKTNNEGMNKSIQKIAKEKEKAEKTKSALGQKDIADFLANIVTDNANNHCSSKRRRRQR